MGRKRRRRVSYPPEVHETAIQRYQTGESPRAIAADLGMHVSSLMNWVRERAIPRNRFRPAHSCGDGVCQKMIRLYTEEYQSLAQIAQQFGVVRSTVRARLLQHGCARRPIGRPEGTTTHQHVCTDRCQRILSDYDYGATLQTLADREGITRERVRQILAMHGIKRRRYGDSKPGIRPQALAKCFGDANPLVSVTAYICDKYGDLAAHDFTLAVENARREAKVPA